MAIPTRNERASKTCKLEVIDRPMVSEMEAVTVRRIMGRRWTRSPKGEMMTRPVA